MLPCKFWLVLQSLLARKTKARSHPRIHIKTVLLDFTEKRKVIIWKLAVYCDWPVMIICKTGAQLWRFLFSVGSLCSAVHVCSRLK